MKKWILPLLVSLLLLAGCQSMQLDEYISVQEHEAPYAVRETVTEDTAEASSPADSVKTISRASDLRNAILKMAEEGRESQQFVVLNYMGDLDADLNNMPNVLLNDSPKHYYAMDSLDLAKARTQSGIVVNVNMKLRLTPQELDAIETRLFPEPAMSDIYKALRQQLSSFTIQISGYQDTDFAALLEEYVLHHPDQIIEMPEISCAVFPKSGNLRVVELHFAYSATRDALRSQREETSSYLNLIYNQISYAENPQQMVETLYKNLLPSFDYKSNEKATVYTQVISKVGSSRTMASVVEYLCNRAGQSCQIVVGQRAGEPWYWNRILSEGRWYYFDLHTAGLQGVPPLLTPAEALEDYFWDPELYPEMEEEVPTEPVETEAPVTEVNETEAAASTEAP